MTSRRFMTSERQASRALDSRSRPSRCLAPGFAVGQPHHAGDAVLLHFPEHELGTEARPLPVTHDVVSPLRQPQPAFYRGKNAAHRPCGTRGDPTRRPRAAFGPVDNAAAACRGRRIYSGSVSGSRSGFQGLSRSRSSISGSSTVESRASRSAGPISSASLEMLPRQLAVFTGYSRGHAPVPARLGV